MMQTRPYRSHPALDPLVERWIAADRAEQALVGPDGQWLSTTSLDERCSAAVDSLIAEILYEEALSVLMAL